MIQPTLADATRTNLIRAWSGSGQIVEHNEVRRTETMDSGCSHGMLRLEDEPLKPHAAIDNQVATHGVRRFIRSQKDYRAGDLRGLAKALCGDLILQRL